MLSSKSKRTYSEKQAKEQVSLYLRDYTINHNENKDKNEKKPNRYEINKLRSRNGHKYNNYKKCFSMIVLISINQHLSNIWGSVNEKVNHY